LQAKNRKHVYGWVQGLLVAQEFTQQDKTRRAIRACVAKLTGLGSASDPAGAEVQATG